MAARSLQFAVLVSSVFILLARPWPCESRVRLLGHGEGAWEGIHPVGLAVLAVAAVDTPPHFGPLPGCDAFMEMNDSPHRHSCRGRSRVCRDLYVFASPRREGSMARHNPAGNFVNLWTHTAPSALTEPVQVAIGAARQACLPGSWWTSGWGSQR